jgi:hypothetical protein
MTNLLAKREPSGRQAGFAITIMIGFSVGLRSIIAFEHPTPRLFADEYIYAALGRSLAHGHLEIRGATSHFPGIFEPLVAAPLWRFFSTTTAYHLVQVENAVVVSLAAIPVYLLARSLLLSRPFSYLCAVYALIIPSLVLINFTSSDAVGYSLALGATAAAVTALNAHHPRNQIMFLVLASAAALTRVEYFVLVPAYLVAALAMNPRSFLREHRVAAIALAPVAAVALVAGFGYYKQGLNETNFNVGYVRWFFLQAFLLTLAAGVVIVPGAIAAILRPVGRRELGFAVYVGLAAMLLLGEATAHAADSLQFKERYLFVLMPILPISFGLYRKHRQPLRWPVVVIASAVLIASARLPLSEYSTASFKQDSQFLVAVSYAQDQLGVASASLVIALIAALASLAAITIALRGHGGGFGVGFALATAFVASVVAIHLDIEAAKSSRANLPQRLTWVDDHARGQVTAIATPGSPSIDLLDQIYWNVSIQREKVLGTGVATDAFNAQKLSLTRSGTLQNVSGDALFDGFGTTGYFAGAIRVAHAGTFALWRPRSGKLKMRLLVEGRFFDNWLSSSGRLRVWPLSRDRGVRIAFRLSLPPTWRKTARLKLGSKTFSVAPGSGVDITCRSSGPLAIPFSSTTLVAQPDFRAFAAKMTRIRITDSVVRGTNSGVACSTTM